MVGNIDTYGGYLAENCNISETQEQTEEKMDFDGVKSEVSDLKNDVILSCLKTDDILYKNYTNTIKKHPEYHKYLQIYTYKGQDFLVVPVYDESGGNLIISTVKIAKNKDESLKITSKPLSILYYPYTRDSDVLPVRLANKYFITIASMNKRTGEISKVWPNDYSIDESGVNGLLGVIGDSAGKKFSDCSKGLQNILKNIVKNKDELRQELDGFRTQKEKLFDNIGKFNISGVYDCCEDIVRLISSKKDKGKVINLGKGLTYMGDDIDFDYLESAINTVLDPEKRSKLTYLISKIKDKRMKMSLKDKGISNPSQFDLFLQQLKPGQLMLTNGLNESEGEGTLFDHAIQTISGSRWCHALLISDVIRDSNGIITDAKIVQSTFKGGVHETRLKEYLNGRFSSADLLLANLPEDKKYSILKSAKAREGQEYDKVSIVTDVVFGKDVDKRFAGDGFVSNILGKNKAYCSELVFDAIEESGLKMPEPHISPSDLLMTDKITPQYACYCEKF